MDRWTKQPQRMHYAAAGGSPEEARGDRWRLTVLPRNGRGLNCMTAGPSCGSIKPGALRYRAICHVPDREYRPREPISISCSDRVCTASGIVDYRAVDPIAKILSEGVASFEYRLAPSGTALKISLENGSVLSSKQDISLFSLKLRTRWSSSFSGRRTSRQWTSSLAYRAIT